MKYIIEIPEQIAEATTDYMKKVGMSIEPYTEPDSKAIEDEVWGFVRIITDMSEAQRIECFGGASCNLDKYWTYQDAKAAYDKWKKDRDEIKVGNEVEYTCCDETVKFVVMDIVGNRAYGFKYPCEYDECGEYCDLDYLRKTGRHFPQLEELLKAMKGESDDD